MDASDYEFYATEIQQIRGTKGVELAYSYPILEFSPQDSDSLNCLVQIWNKCTDAIVNYHLHAGLQKPRWCGDNVVGWAKHKPLENQLKYAAWHGKILAGVVNLRISHPSTDSQVVELARCGIVFYDSA